MEQSHLQYQLLWVPIISLSPFQVPDLRRSQPLLHSPAEPLSLHVDAPGGGERGVLHVGVKGTPSYKPLLFLSRKFSDFQIHLHSSLELETINLIDCFTNEDELRVTDTLSWEFSNEDQAN